MLHHRFAFLLFALWPLCAGAQTLTVADSVQTYATLTGTTVTMTGKSELHVTGTSNPIAGSIIHLNSHDSWFWLDNIRPNTADDYLGQIKVNGVTAVHGTNVRVVQYGMGTVIMPFTNAEQPLETFTGPMFTGDSKLFTIYTYYNTDAALGTMAGNISSFKLKRGYMATFGTSPDGTGTSKVYIAQDHDLTVGSMPGNLENAVHFVRVFPWRWVSKKGSCDVAADKLNATWFYNWNNDQNSTLNWEYVPIRQQRYWPALPTNKTSVTHLSGYNEPDNSVEDSYGSLNNGSTAVAVATYPELLATGLRVGSPACTDGGKAWLYDFMDKANAAGVRVDYITIHFYWCGQSAAQLKAWLQEIWDRYHKPIWLTEFNNGANWTGCGDPSYAQEASVINSWIDMMDTTPWIERYAVYSNVESTRNMVYNDGSLTPAGAVYRDQQSPIGYLQEEYTMAVKRGVVQLPLDGNTRDASGYDNRGVCYGVPAYAAGQYGQALQFNGSNVHVKLPPAVVNTSSMTFASWVYWDGGAGSQRIFDFGNDTSQFFYLTPNVGGEMRLGLRNGDGTTDNIVTTALPTGSWQHVAVTMQGSTAKIYLNGVQQVQGTLPDAALSGTMQNYLGKSQWPADPYFNGKLDDVTIADSAMTDVQIAALMANTLPPFAAHWKGDVDGNWSTNNSGNTNWATDAGGATDAGQSPAVNTAVNFSTGGGNSSNTILGADFSIDGLSVTTSSAVGIGGTHNLTIGDNGIDITSGAGATAINTSGQVMLGANQTWSNNSAAALTVNSVVAGGGTLNVGGSGVVALNGMNTLTGEVVIFGGGTVSVPSVTNSLGSASVVRMGGGGSTGRIVYTGTGETTSRVLTFNGGLGTPGMVLDQSGSGLLKFTANTAANASVSKTLTLQGSSGGTGEFAGIISNGGTTTSLTKTGTGTWTLSGANTYSGTTVLNAGVLAIGHNAAFGTGTVDLRGGTLQSSDATARTVANALSVSADTTFGGTGNLLFTGAVNAGSLTKTFIVNNARTEFSGVVSGSGARVKAGGGTLVLGGANSYTGATTVSAGTLAINGSLAAGSAVTVANGATLTGTGNVKGATIFANGSRLGWSLAANSGTAGKLTTAAVSVTSGAGVNLVFNGPGSTADFTNAFWDQSHIWQVLASTGMTGTFTLGTVSTDSAGHAVAGNFYLQQNSTGVKLFYAPPGAQPPPTPTGLSVSVAPGGVTLSWNASQDAVGYNILRSIHSGGPYEIVATDVAGTSYGDKSVSNGTTYYYVVVAMSPNGESPPTSEIVAVPHLPSTIDKAENSINLTQTDSWVGGIVPVASDTARWTGLAGSNSVSLGADAAWNGIIVGATGGPVSIGAGNTLTLGKGGIDMSAGTQNLTIASGLALSSVNQNWQVPAGKILALPSGTFARPVGATLNIQGTGVISSGMTNEGSTSILGPWATVGSGTATTYVTLSGGNLASFTAGTNVSSASFPNPSTTNDNYNFTTASTTTYGAATRNANTIRNTVGATTLTFGNSASQINLVTNGILNAGTGLLTVTHGGSHVSSGIQIGPNNGRELVVNAANSGVSLGRIIDGSGGASSVTVNTSGANTVTLTTASTFTGGVHLNSGTLLAGSNTALGTGTFNLKGGTFGTTAALTIASPINIAGANVVGHAAQAGDLTLSGPLSGNGTLTNFTGSSAATNLFLTGDLSGFTGTLDYTCRTGNDTQWWRFGTNNAMVDLSNASVIVRAGNVTNLITAASKNFGFRDGISGATLKLGSLAGDGVFQASYNNAGPNTLEVGALNADTTFSGALAGGNSGTKVNLTKVGNGTLTLTGTHPYSGTTTIHGGTLMVNGLLTGNSAVTVNNGGTLAGSGTSSGAVTVTGGGAIAPGNSSGGVLTISGGLTFNDGSILNMALGTGSSRITLGGTFAAGGITTVNVTALAGFGAGTYSLITGAAGIDASNFAVGTIPGGFTCGLSAINGTLSLTVEAILVAPASLTAADGSQSIALSWTASSAATSYTVKRSTTSGTGYATIASDVTATNYADTGLTVGTTYYYVVSAVKLGSESEDSSEASARALSASEAWRKQKFGTTDNGGDAADGADPDKDGLINLLEYALGSNPITSNASATPHAAVANGNLTISFTRNATATDIVLNVWGTDDLASGTWEEIARSSGGSAFTNELNGISTGAPVIETGEGPLRSVQVGDVFAIGTPSHPKRFLKLQAER